MSFQNLKELLKSCRDGNKILNMHTSSSIRGDLIWDFDEPFKEKLTETIGEIPGMENLVGTMLNMGTWFRRFELNQLVDWLADPGRLENPEKLVEQVSRFIHTREFDGYDVFPLNGIRTDREIDLGIGLRLLPYTHLPDSTAKKIVYLTYPLGMTLAPDSAIVGPSYSIKKLQSDAEDVPGTKNESTISKVQDWVKLVSLVKSVKVEAFAYWWQPNDDIPCLVNMATYFGGAGVVEQFPSHELTDEEIAQLDYLYRKYWELAKKGQRRKAEIAMDYLQQGIRKRDYGERLLDFCIAMEVLLLAENDELAFRLRLRASRLLALELNDRTGMFHEIKEIYNARSSLVHNGYVSKPGELRNLSKRAREILRSLLIKQIESKIPSNSEEWEKVDLS